MKKYTVLMLEDTPEDQEVFRHYVSQLPVLTIAGVVEQAEEARLLLQTGAVDLFVSDIHLSGQSGIELLRTLPNPPPVILTTVSVTHSLDAYELGVVDYLVKPFSFERFRLAVERALPRQETGAVALPPPATILLKEGHSTVLVPLAQIRYVEADGPYCKLHLTNSVRLVSHLLADIEERLPTGQFVRVHRSYVVAVAHISRVRARAVDIGDQSIPVGLRYRNALREFTPQPPR